MSKGYKKLRKKRFERKFVTRHLSPAQVGLMIKQNSAGFSPIFSPRQINNIYFDTPGFNCYFGNLFGTGNRWKARIRWYGDMFGKIESPIFEFKVKYGFTGKKKSFRIPSFIIGRDYFDASQLIPLITGNKVPKKYLHRLLGLQPVLLNGYQRKYYISANRKLRITIDENLIYYNLRPTWNHFNRPFSEDGKTVIELKYNVEYDDQAREVTAQFPIRLEKNSKFVSGMMHFKSDIPL